MLLRFLCKPYGYDFIFNNCLKVILTLITVTEPLYHKDDDDRIYIPYNTLPTSTKTSTRKFLPSPLFIYSNWLPHHHQLNVSMANIPQWNKTKFTAEFSTKIKISILANPLYFISQHHCQQTYISFVMKLELCTSMKIQQFLYKKKSQHFSFQAYF